MVDFGASVKALPGTHGLLHISEISENRVKNVRHELREGDQILVKVLALAARQTEDGPELDPRGRTPGSALRPGPSGSGTGSRPPVPRRSS